MTEFFSCSSLLCMHGVKLDGHSAEALTHLLFCLAETCLISYI